MMEKSVNAITNDRIQELANSVIDKGSKNVRSNMNELMSLLMPKLRFFIWGFMSSENDTDDVLYNTLEKICISIKSYNPNYRFTTWAFNIAKNEALTWINKTPKNNVDIDEIFYTVANSLIDNSVEVMDSELQREEVLADVYDEIQRVSIEEGNLMLLEKDINDRKGKEIAEMYGTCENTVKTRIRAGRKRVRESVFNKHPDLVARMVIFEL